MMMAGRSAAAIRSAAWTMLSRWRRGGRWRDGLGLGRADCRQHVQRDFDMDGARAGGLEHAEGSGHDFGEFGGVEDGVAEGAEQGDGGIAGFAARAAGRVHSVRRSWRHRASAQADIQAMVQ